MLHFMMILSVNFFISKSKTYQYRNGNEILILKGTTSACPVFMLRREFLLAEISNEADNFLFKPIFGGKSVSKLTYQNKKLSYTRTKECIVSRLSEVVVG